MWYGQMPVRFILLGLGLGLGRTYLNLFLPQLREPRFERSKHTSEDTLGYCRR
jgi:hypothetical protein